MLTEEMKKSVKDLVKEILSENATKVEPSENDEAELEGQNFNELSKSLPEDIESEEDIAKAYEGFEAVKENAAKNGAKNPAAVAAAVGRKKYGKERYDKMIQAGKPGGKKGKPAPGKKSMDNDADDKGKDKDMKKSNEGESNAPETQTQVAQPQAEAEEFGKLSTEEIELVKAWRASQAEEAEAQEISKAASTEAQEGLKKALDSQKEENEALRKSIEAQNDLIKGLTEKVEKMASQPAYDKKAVTTLEPVEKSQPETEKASKRQVIDTLLTLQQEGDKDVNSHVISKYEATNQLSKSLQEKVKTQILKGK